MRDYHTFEYWWRLDGQYIKPALDRHIASSLWDAANKAGFAEGYEQATTDYDNHTGVFKNFRSDD